MLCVRFLRRASIQRAEVNSDRPTKQAFRAVGDM